MFDNVHTYIVIDIDSCLINYCCDIIIGMCQFIKVMLNIGHHIYANIKLNIS